MDILLKLVVLIVVSLFKLGVWLTRKGIELARAMNEEAAPIPPISAAPARPARATAAASARSPGSPSASDSAAVLRAVDDLAGRARAAAAMLEQQRGARRFLPAIATWVPTELAVLRQRVATGALLSAAQRRRLHDIVFVMDEVEAMAADRRDPHLAASLGDADALATACYQPIIDHARAEGLPLTVAEPAARWGDFDMSVMTGFVPTGVAPLFLPQEFFTRLAWWPALAHEIGHSFLASVRGLDRGLRTELELPEEVEGLLLIDSEVVSYGDVARVCGGWFEELFCDVFGTLMCGPAYVRTMTTLFARPDNPTSVAIVDETVNGYAPHPPRHLRVIAGCRTLARAGLNADAAALRAEWEDAHRVGGDTIDRIVYPTLSSRFVSIPLPVIEEMVNALVDRLHEGPFDALGGFGLTDIPGLGYGPHAHAETKRARDALFAGRVPTVRDPRAIIAGAVLAAHARPSQELRFLTAARAAIPALGTGEVRPDAYAPSAVPRSGAASRAGELRDALVLQAVLARPRSTRSLRHARYRVS